MGDYSPTDVEPPRCAERQQDDPEIVNPNVNMLDVGLAVQNLRMMLKEGLLDPATPEARRLIHATRHRMMDAMFRVNLELLHVCRDGRLASDTCPACGRPRPVAGTDRCECGKSFTIQAETEGI